MNYSTSLASDFYHKNGGNNTTLMNHDTKIAYIKAPETRSNAKSMEAMIIIISMCLPGQNKISKAWTTQGGTKGMCVYVVRGGGKRGCLIPTQHSFTLHSPCSSAPLFTILLQLHSHIFQSKIQSSEMTFKMFFVNGRSLLSFWEWKCGHFGSWRSLHGQENLAVSQVKSIFTSTVSGSEHEEEREEVAGTEEVQLGKRKQTHT